MNPSLPIYTYTGQTFWLTNALLPSSLPDVRPVSLASYPNQTQCLASTWQKAGQGVMDFRANLNTNLPSLNSIKKKWSQLLAPFNVQISQGLLPVKELGRYASPEKSRSETMPYFVWRCRPEMVESSYAYILSGQHDWTNRVVEHIFVLLLRSKHIEYDSQAAPRCS